MKVDFTKSLIVTLFMATLTACSSVPVDGTNSEGNLNNRDGSVSGDIHGKNGINESLLDPFNPQSSLAQQRSVYFEFNSFNVAEQYRSVVEKHARYLETHTQQHIRIEGNTDQRGGAEYNLALGQRRADAVRRMMGLLGVNESQIETISLGKEKPKAEGNSEADYAENRRADIIYQR